MVVVTLAVGDYMFFFCAMASEQKKASYWITKKLHLNKVVIYIPSTRNNLFLTCNIINIYNDQHGKGKQSTQLISTINIA